MPFRKGRKRTGGRAKGVQNVTTRVSKELTEQCFEGIGGLKRFMKWADKNETDFYTRVWTKLFPVQMVSQVRVEHEHEFDGAAELFARLISDGAAAITARRDHLKLIEGKASEAPAQLGSVGKKGAAAS